MLRRRLDALVPTLGAREVASLAESLGEPSPADGRAARSHRTRRAIVDAMRTLHAEGDLRPTATRIAEVAGVSLRTVWQHFEDRETLLLEATRRDLEVLLSLIEPIDPAIALPERIAEFAGQQARLLEQMAPSWRAARSQEPFSPQLQGARKQLAALARAEVGAVFAPELDRLPRRRAKELLDALVAISGGLFWEALRTDVGNSPPEAQRVLVTALTALLAQADMGDR